MNVRELRDILAKLPDDLPIVVEVTFDDGDGFEGAELMRAAVEARCDEVERLYLWGDQDGEEETRPPALRLVRSEDGE